MEYSLEHLPMTLILYTQFEYYRLPDHHHGKRLHSSRTDLSDPEKTIL